MARRTTPKRGKPQGGSGPNLGQLLRAELIGAVLVVVALLLLLSMASANQGALTAAIIAALRTLFGPGAAFVPILLAAFGAWLAVRAVTEQSVLTPQRLLGLLALFLIFESLLYLFVGGEDPFGGQAGGLIGYLIGQGLVMILGAPAAIAGLGLGAVAGLIALTGVRLPQIAQALQAAWRRLRGTTPGPEGARPNPPLPLGEGMAPWRRAWRWLKERFAPEPADVSGLPPSPFLPWEARPSAAAGSSAVRALTPAGPAAPTPPAEPAPRIIGGGATSWRLPLIADILEDATEQDIQSEDLRKRAEIIETTLASFGVPVQVIEANRGPAVTQFGLRPGVIVRKDRKGQETRVKVRVAQIQALANDLALALSASPLRIEAPVPGRDVVGVEVPNVQISMVSLRGVLESEEFRAQRGLLTFGLGRDVSGQAVVADLVRMPHLLIAGATGSGKSVCVNSIITALLLTHTPDTLRFLMIDPKRVELTVYNGIPHLIAPVVVDVERAVPVLQWATREMERRYKLLARAGARNIETYNDRLAARGEPVLPYIVILVDELADLMLSAPEEVERYICRIAQMARAVGIHLVIATQRPSVDVVTGLIKANFPARIAFAVTSQVDSRVILDTPGAEQLLGRGDMLYMAPDSSKLQRLQGCFVSDRETSRLVSYWKAARTLGPEMEPLDAAMSADAEEATPPAAPTAQPTGAAAPASEPLEPPWLPGQEVLQQPLWDEVAAAEQAARSRDDLYAQAVAEVRKAGRASVSLLQRRLRIGYSRAARLIDELEANGVIGPDLGNARGREVLPEKDQAG
ncbi:MAG: DNA translocase FtsK 4TM domain-containing protein [Anaerolineae bacterium]